MRCLYCQKKLGFHSRLTVGNFCSREHRKLAAARSARVLREYNSAGEDDLSDVFVKPIDGLTKQPPQQSSVGSSLVFATIMLGAMAVGSLSFGGGRAADSAASDAFSGMIARLRSYTAIKRTEAFDRGAASWMAVTAPTVRTPDWTFTNGMARPGRLRLWSESLRLKDYQIEFEGQIERGAMSWVYRAADVENYHASKILLSGKGPMPRADLVRYTVIAGRSFDRRRTPLPIVTTADMVYKVQQTLKGSDFSLRVNGKLVDSWSDPRLLQGGVGFFAEKGEVATLRYVTVTDTDTPLGRALATFGFFMPVAPAE